LSSTGCILIRGSSGSRYIRGNWVSNSNRGRTFIKRAPSFRARCVYTPNHIRRKSTYGINLQT
jgi:hypothetical protein